MPAPRPRHARATPAPSKPKGNARATPVSSNRAALVWVRTHLASAGRLARKSFAAFRNVIVMFCGQEQSVGLVSPGIGDIGALAETCMVYIMSSLASRSARSLKRVYYH
eukprot:gene16320-biopygen15812